MREAQFDASVPFPVEAVVGLKGPARLRAETMILRQLEELDVRVPDALVKLGAAWTAPVLADVATAPEASAELRTSLADAARTLTTS